MQATVGAKVQDYFGTPGVVLWVGKLEKADKPPNGDTGTYCAVQFEEPTNNLMRTDGTWNGKRFATGAPGTIQFIRQKHLQPLMEPQALQIVRDKYKEKLADWHDVEIIKFCMARKYDYPKVFEMIDNHLKWLAEARPAQHLLEYYPPEMAADYPVGFGDGTDRDGNLLFFDRPGGGGKCDPSVYVKKWGLERAVRWHMASMELGKRMMRDSGFKQRRVTLIVDLAKLGDLDRAVIKYAKSIAKIDQDHYPEHLAKLYIINAPMLFSGLWRIVRVFVDDRTKEKITICGSDYRQALEQQIDPMYLPSFAGGTNDSWLRDGGRIGVMDEAAAAAPAAAAAVPGALQEVDDADLAHSGDKTPAEKDGDKEMSVSPTSTSK